MKNLKKHLIDHITLLTISLGFFPLLDILSKDLNYKGMVIVIIYFILFLLHTRIRIDDPFTKRLFNTISFLPMNFWLWIFGNVWEHKLLNDIHKTTLALQESILFGRLAELKKSDTKYYHIIFTHKGNHDASVGHKDLYRIPGFPFDEAEIIMRLWYFIASALNLDWSNIRTMCSCSYGNEYLKNNIIGQSFSIVGSPKENKFSALLMDKIEELEGKRLLIRKEDMYTMRIDNGLCYLHDRLGITDLKSDPTNPSNPDLSKDMIDYAMIMKLPNILQSEGINKRQTIMLFAGCKAAGQFTITDWFFRPENLATLTSKYSSKYFYVILKTKYKFVPQSVPNIIETELLYEGEIEIK